MRFVDEFRDAETARALAARIAALCEPGRRYKFMEVCGGPHAHDLQARAGGLPARDRHAGARPRLPGVRDPDGPGRRRHRASPSSDDVILTSFGDMMRVPGGRGSFFDAKAAGADIRMVYSPLDALKIARQNPDKRVVFMAIGFETTAPSTAMTVLRAAAEGLDELLDLLQPRDDHPGDQGHPGLARPAARRLHRPRPRVDGHRLPAVRVHRARVRQAAGVRRVRAAGHPAVGLPAAAAARRGPLRGREPVRPRRAVGRQPQGAAGDRRGDGAAAALRVARARLHRAVGAAGARARTRSSTPSGSSQCPACGSPTPRRASAARCSRACSSRGSARCSAPRARRRRRSAPAWCPPRAPARRTTTSAGSAGSA